MRTSFASSIALILGACTGTLASPACFKSSANPSGGGADFDSSAEAGFEGGPDGTTPGDAGPESSSEPESGVDSSPLDSSSADTSTPVDSGSGGHDASTDSAPGDSAVPDGSPEGSTIPGLVVGPLSTTWPTGLTFIGSTLYWLDTDGPYNGGALHSCTTTGGACSSTTLFSNASFDTEMTSDGTTLFFPLGYPSGSGTSERLYSCTAATCSSSTLSSLSDVGFWTDLTGVAVLGTQIYYSGGAPPSSYSLLYGNKDGSGSGYFLLQNQSRTSNLAVDANSLYFGLVAGGIYTCAIGPDAGTTCTPTLLQATGSTWGLAVDSSSIYWSDPVAGAIYSCPLAGCGAATPTTIASGLGPVGSIALSGTMLYYAIGDSSDAGTTNGIFAAPK